MLKLVEMIKTALNEIGCEELPSGCDDLSMEQTFVDTNANREQQVSVRYKFNFLGGRKIHQTKSFVL